MLQEWMCCAESWMNNEPCMGCMKQVFPVQCRNISHTRKSEPIGLIDSADKDRKILRTTEVFPDTMGAIPLGEDK